ncbi:hypothetical protein LJR231_003264 [Phyllobacterium sp. LjRoot231]|uniref:hypothetical protein n=1 Tax=Phyllobacterium sp. LjRoot231 TaxID=3342289 RepID=UPI003ED06E4C
MNTLVEAFKLDDGAETLVLVQEIANDDTALTLDVYTRDKRNARLALVALKAAIGDLLMEWDTHKYRRLAALLPSGTEQPSPKCKHYRVKKWPLHIARSGK